MAAPTPKYPSFDKRAIRKELSGMTIEQLSETIKYHQQKAGMNQRIVAIAKLILKSKEASSKDSVLNLAAKNLETLRNDDESSKVIDSSNDNAELEQPSDSNNSEDD